MRLLKARRGDFTGADPAPGAFVAAPGTQRYQYDFVGNIQSTQILANANESASAADRKLTGSFNAVNEQTNYVEQVGASTSTATFAITHDAAGNVRTRETVAGGNRLAYRHDRWGRLTEVDFQVKTTSGYDPKPRARYRYNALGMRALVERDADTTDGTNSINERRYLYYNAAWQIVEEHVDAGFASASDPVSIDRIVQNIWGLRYIDDLVLRRVDANYPGSGPPSFAETASGDIDWEQYLTDHQFSVVAAVGRTGTLAFRVAYDAFGEARHLPAKDINGDGKVDKTDTTLAQNASGKTLGQPGYNPDADWNRDGKITSADVAQFGSRSYIAALPQGQLAQPGSATQPAATTTTAAANAARAANARSDFNIGFSGYRFNGDIGAYTVRFRHYDPTPGMCRWLERDPAGYQDGPSLYSYLGRNPMAGTDPYGLWFTDWAEDLSFWWHGGKNLSVPQYHQGWRDGKRGRWKHYYVDGEIGATWWIPEYAGGARLSWHDENLNRAAQLERERIDRFQEFRRAGANAVAIGAASVVVAGMTLTPGPEEVIAGAILTRVGVGARVGLVASDGLVIRGFTKHGIDRVVGDGAKRAGVNPRAILDALKSPVRVVEQIDERGRLSRKYAGANATVVVNPATGQIITVYPTNTTGTHYP